MKTKIASIFRGLAALVLPVLFLTSCFEQSIVVKVNKDGSGIVHERSYANNAMGGMMGGFGEVEGAEVTVEESGPDIPTEAELQEAAAAMGEGVTFKSVTEGKNNAGWTGYEVVYEFTDVNKLKVDMNNLGSDMEDGMGDMEGIEGASEVIEEAKKEEFVTFEMADGVLKILTPDPSESLSEAGGGGPAAGGPGGEGAPGGAENPFGGDPSDPQAAMGMQMMAGMMAGMRLGVFVQGGDPIAKTNALHQNGNLITLMMMDMGKMLQNPANMAKMQGLEGQASSRAQIQEVIDGVGVTADLQEPIVVEFQ